MLELKGYVGKQGPVGSVGGERAVTSTKQAPLGTKPSCQGGGKLRGAMGPLATANESDSGDCTHPGSVWSEKFARYWLVSPVEFFEFHFR